jgi:hypothetical protein
MTPVGGNSRMKTGLFMLTMVALTSIGTYLVGVKWLGLRSSALRPALDKALEYVGAAVLFSLLNVGLATAIVLSLRGITGRFLSVYVVNDVTWLALSFVQGLTFHCWRELARAQQRSTGS